MPHRLAVRPIALAAAAALLAACNVAGLPAQPAAPAKAGQASLKPTGSAATGRPSPGPGLAKGAGTAAGGLKAPTDTTRFEHLSGVVRAPSAVSPENGAGLVSDFGLGLISKTKVDYRAWHLLAAEERPLAGTAVFLLDATGKQVARAVTDAAGGYAFAKVPAGTYKVVAAGQANGKAASLATLARTGGTADVSLATTVVAAQCLKAANGKLADFDAARFTTLTGKAASTLATTATLPDLSSAEAIAAWNADNLTQELLADIADLAREIEAMADELAAEAAKMAAEAEAEADRLASEAQADADRIASEAQADADQLQKDLLEDTLGGTGASGVAGSLPGLPRSTAPGASDAPDEDPDTEDAPDTDVE